MSDPFIGEIRMFAGTFAPVGWALCDGGLLAVNQNDALFSLIGSTYGGDGETTFAVPDLRGRIPIHYGSGPGLTQRNLGAKAGTENETVTVSELASHTHDNSVSPTAGTQNTPDGAYLGSSPNVRIFSPIPPSAPMGSDAITSVGGGLAHTNVMPFLCVNFIIALVGIFPSQF